MGKATTGATVTDFPNGECEGEIWREPRPLKRPEVRVEGGDKIRACRPTGTRAEKFVINYGRQRAIYLGYFLLLNRGCGSCDYGDYACY